MDTSTAACPRRVDELPSPPGLPVLGQLLALDPPRLHQILEGWQAELGSPYVLRLGPRKVYVSADPELLQTALRERPERYRRLRQIEACTAEMGSNGVFSVEGDAWRPQRKLVMEGLNATHFRGFFPALQAITARLHRRWLAASARGDTVEMTQDLVRYTVDVTTALAFGEDPCVSPPQPGQAVAHGSLRADDHADAARLPPATAQVSTCRRSLHVRCSRATCLPKGLIRQGRASWHSTCFGALT